MKHYFFALVTLTFLVGQPGTTVGGGMENPGQRPIADALGA